MKQTSAFRIFLSYLGCHRFTLLLFGLFAGIFAVVFSLYTLQPEPVIYSVVLCLFSGAVLTLLRFPRYLRLHRKLNVIKDSILLMVKQLPEPSGLIEKDYQELLLSLNQLYSRKITDSDMARNDLTDYYTTWVHQIKTPIAAMRLLLQNEDIPAGRQLKTELLRIEQYVEMVLCYFRLDSPSSDFVLKYYSLNEIIRQSIRKFAGQFIQKKLRLIYEPTDRQVLTDEKWLSFVLDQLLSNALKYTSTGSITISVDENLVLSISDTGIGIAPEDLPRIFERSYTGYNGRAEKAPPGSGCICAARFSCACRIPSPFPLKSEKEAPSPSTCPGSSWMWNNARPGTARQIFFQPFTFARFGCHLSDREMAADLMPCYTDSRTAAGRNAPGLSLPKTGKARSGRWRPSAGTIWDLSSRISIFWIPLT